MFEWSSRPILSQFSPVWVLSNTLAAIIFFHFVKFIIHVSFLKQPQNTSQHITPGSHFRFIRIVMQGDVDFSSLLHTPSVRDLPIAHSSPLHR